MTEVNPKSDDLAARHTPEAIRRRLSGRVRHSYLSDFIYGGIDGAVTTFAIVSGVAGSGLSPAIVIILGCANLLGDGFSMAAANFLGARARRQQLLRTRRSEHREIELNPAGEREEIRQIFEAKGLSGDTLEDVVRVITANRERWVDTMIMEEHGLALEDRSPWMAAAMTFMAFCIIGFIPLMPFILVAGGVDLSRPFLASTALMVFAMFAVGAMKTRFVEQRWWLGGLETLFVGGLAAALAYGVGWALSDLTGGAAG